MTGTSGEEKVIKCSHTKHLLSNLICSSHCALRPTVLPRKSRILWCGLCVALLFMLTGLSGAVVIKIIGKKKELMEKLYNSSKESLF